MWKRTAKWTFTCQSLKHCCNANTWIFGVGIRTVPFGVCFFFTAMAVVLPFLIKGNAWVFALPCSQAYWISAAFSLGLSLFAHSLLHDIQPFQQYCAGSTTAEEIPVKPRRMTAKQWIKPLGKTNYTARVRRCRETASSEIMIHNLL